MIDYTSWLDYIVLRKGDNWKGLIQSQEFLKNSFLQMVEKEEQRLKCERFYTAVREGTLGEVIGYGLQELDVVSS